MWDGDMKRLKTILEGHTASVMSVDFSFNGYLLASKSQDNTVRLWRCDTWENVAVLDESASDYWMPGLTFHPKASVLATLGAPELFAG